MATIIPKPGETLEEAICRFRKTCQNEGVFKDMKRAADVKRLQSNKLSHKAHDKRSEALKRAEQRRIQLIHLRNPQPGPRSAAPEQITNKE